MAEFERQDFISDEALQAPHVLRKNMEDLLKTMNDVRKAGMDFNATFKNVGDSGGMSTRKLAEETEKLALEQEQLKKISEQLAVAMARDNDAYREQEKQLQAVRKEMKAKSEIGTKDALLINKTNASITELNAALAKNRAAYAALRTEEQRNSEEGKKLLAVIQQQDSEYKELTGSMGQHQAKVGDYEGAMRNMKKELKAAQDEMVVLGQTLGTDSAEFVAAAEKAGKLKDEIGDLQESTRNVSGSPIENLGNSFSSVAGKIKNLDFKGAADSAKQFAQISKSITFKEATAGIGSFGKTMLQVGKALLTNPFFLIAAVVVAVGIAIFELKDKLKPLTIAFDAVGKAIDTTIQYLKDFSDWMGISSFAADEKAKSVVEGANKELQAVQESYDRQIKIAKSQGKDTIDLEKAKWNAVIAEATKGLNGLLIIEKNSGKELEGEELKQREAYYKMIGDANTEIQVLENTAAAEKLAKQKEADEKTKEQNAKAAEDLKKSQEEQRKIREDAAKKKKEDEEKAAKQKEEDEAKRIAKEKQDALDELAFKDEVAKMAVEAATSYANELNQVNDKNVAAYQKEIAERLRDTSLSEDQRAKIIRDADAHILEMRKKNAREALDNQIKALEESLVLLTVNEEEKAKVEQQIHDLKMQQAQEEYDAIDRNQQTNLEKTQAYLEQTQQYFQTFAEGFGALFSSLTEQRLQDIQMEQDALKKKLDAEMAFYAGNEEKKSQIKNEFDRKNAQLEKQKIQAQRRQAIFDKAVAATQAAIQVALKVIEYGVVSPLAIATGIAGAAMVAAILAKPIPQYELGTDDHKGGYAIVGEKGSELMNVPGKGWTITPDRPTLMHLPAHTQVIPSDESMRILAINAMGYTIPTKSRESDFSGYSLMIKGISSLEKTVKNKKETHFNISRKGAEIMMKNAETRIKFLNEFYR